MRWPLAADEARLHGGAPWWLVSHGLAEAATALPTRADVLVIGAGITGALVADHLTRAGLSVAIVDRRLPASGSTAASTALLQYELDTELLALGKMVGAAAAARVYRQCAATIDGFDELTASLPDRCGFGRRTSVYLATSRRDVGRLQREADARQQIGISATFWNPVEVSAQYGLPGYGAVVSELGAVIDPVALTRALLDRSTAAGATLAPWTTALEAEDTGDGLRVVTTAGAILVDRIVLACGYEVPASLVPATTSLHSTFALITDPLPDPGALHDSAVVWESSRPYHYMRTVGRRLLIGGRDLPFRDVNARDALIPARTRQLEATLHEWQPDLVTRTSFSWAGTFGETEDGMPVIGSVPGTDRIHYALGYGGNGIVFSLIAAELLRDLCLGRANPELELYRRDSGGVRRPRLPSSVELTCPPDSPGRGGPYRSEFRMRHSRPLLVLLLACAAAPVTARAQESLGIKAGAAFSTLSDKSPDWNNRTGFAGGIAFDLRAKFIGLQPEVLYVQKGVNFNGTPTGNASAPQLAYIDVPILVKLTLPTPGIQPMVYAGPSIDFLVGCSFNGIDCQDDVKKTDYGVVLGGGIRIGGDRGFTIEGRYTWGLKDINDLNAGVEHQTRTFLLLAGVSL